MLQFTQEEVEKELSDNFPHGTRIDVSRISGLGESYLKRQFNPNDETASCAFRILQVACALDDVNPEVGDKFWQTLTRFRDLSKMRTKPGKKLCLNVETGKLNKEIAEFVSAKFADLPIKDQLKELLDAKDQLEIVEKHILAELDALGKKAEEQMGIAA